MILINAELENNSFAWKFFQETSIRLNKGVKVEALTRGVSIKTFTTLDKRFISFGYALFNEWLTRVIGLMLLFTFAYFGGFTPWLTIPFFILFIEYFIGLFGYWLMYKGLRKAGYKDKIKFITNKKFIERGVHNGTK